MLKYTTILESKKFKLSKVKNTTTKKSWYSILYTSYTYTITVDHNIFTDMNEYFGHPYKLLSTGKEWKFRDLHTATKKYRWALMRWA